MLIHNLKDNNKNNKQNNSEYIKGSFEKSGLVIRTNHLHYELDAQ